MIADTIGVEYEGHVADTRGLDVSLSVHEEFFILMEHNASVDDTLVLRSLKLVAWSQPEAYMIRDRCH